jgi:hypothetical protein
MIQWNGVAWWWRNIWWRKNRFLSASFSLMSVAHFGNNAAAEQNILAALLKQQIKNPPELERCLLPPTPPQVQLDLLPPLDFIRFLDVIILYNFVPLLTKEEKKGPLVNLLFFYIPLPFGEAKGWLEFQ